MRSLKSNKKHKGKPLSETKSSFTILVKRLTRVSMLGVGSITLSVAVVKSALIPDQLNWIVATGSIVVALAVVTVYQQSQASRWQLRRPLSVVIFASLIALLVLHSTLIIEISVNDTPINYLIGWKLTESATKLLQPCNGTLDNTIGSVDPKVLFSCAGPDMIPRAYGWSYRIAYALYALFYLALVASFASTVTVALMRQSHTQFKFLKRVL